MSRDAESETRQAAFHLLVSGDTKKLRAADAATHESVRLKYALREGLGEMHVESAVLGEFVGTVVLILL